VNRHVYVVDHYTPTDKTNQTTTPFYLLKPGLISKTDQFRSLKDISERLVSYIKYEDGNAIVIRFLVLVR